MRRLLVLSIALVFLFVGCTTKTVNNGELVQYRIGISQLVQHEALDQARKGFIDGLAEAGYVDGDNIVIDYQNAQGDIPTTNTIATKLVNGKNDLILGIATPSAQALANATKEIPILITAVTDPADAKLVASNEHPGGNITGTSDMAPIKEQVEMLYKLVPNAKTVGILYNSGESNSKLQAQVAKQELEQLGLAVNEYTVSEISQINVVAQNAVSKVDAIYVPTDNMIVANMPTVASIAIDAKVPIITAEAGGVEKGALATYGISYYELGKITAAQAVRILNGENPANMAIEYQTEFELTINEDTRKKLGIELPADLK